VGIKKVQKSKIVCLCGPVRWAEAFAQANMRESLAGRIVLSIAGHARVEEERGLTKEQKKALDELHFRKIDMADEILVINVEGYVGESTGREIFYAIKKKKKIRFWEQNAIGVYNYIRSQRPKIPNAGSIEDFK